MHSFAYSCAHRAANEQSKYSTDTRSKQGSYFGTNHVADIISVCYTYNQPQRFADCLANTANAQPDNVTHNSPIRLADSFAFYKPECVPITWPFVGAFGFANKGPVNRPESVTVCVSFLCTYLFTNARTNSVTNSVSHEKSNHVSDHLLQHCYRELRLQDPWSAC